MQQSHNDGFAKTIWHFEIGGGREDVKSSPEDKVLFLVVLLNSIWLRSLGTLDVVVVLTSRSFPIPFCTSRILYCLMSRQWFLKYRKMEILLLAQNCLSLVPWRIKVSLEALPYQYQTIRFSHLTRRCSVVVSFVQ